MKRASIKAQGHDIFFGGTEEIAPTVTHQGSAAQVPTSARPVTSAAVSPDAPPSGRPDLGMSAHRDVQTSASEEEQFFAPLEIPPPLRRRLRALLRDERRIHTTVRFSPEEMAALRDLVYQLEAKMGIKITRNEVMRIALHFFLEDYELRKKESLLLQVLEEIDD
jgi:hypothetical protein